MQLHSLLLYFISILSVIAVVLYSISNEKHLYMTRHAIEDNLVANYHSIRRSLGGPPTPTIDRGYDNIVENRTVYAALVVKNNPQYSDKFHSTNDTLELSGNTIKFRKWLSIETKPCPAYHHLHGSHRNRTERGHGLSHLQLWLEFAFFDRDVLEARFRKVPEYVTSNSYSSVSGIFQAVENGSLYRDGRLFQKEDILLVTEESLDTFKHVNVSRLLDRMGTMTNGMAVIATCHQAHAICMHAYAITRDCAESLAEMYDVCGPPPEQQLYGFWKRQKLHVYPV
jgi:hypothetical protein